MFGNPLNSLDPTQRVECGRPTVMIVRGDKRTDVWTVSWAVILVQLKVGNYTFYYSVKVTGWYFVVALTNIFILCVCVIL